MPAKGWRKDEQESNMETAIANQGISIDSILFPKSTINKLAKKTLADESGDQNPMILAKDSQTVIQRSAVVFINYIYHNAKQYIKAKGRKVVNADDIILALQTANFNSFVPVLQEELEKFNRRKELKQKEKMYKKQAKAAAGTENDHVEIGDVSTEPENDNESKADDDDESGDSTHQNKRAKRDESVANNNENSAPSQDNNESV
ncbi:hypothetical protein BRETT_004906 [Brettanomyces bruxellensis]|uniref:DNA polymerase epsilon subunit D n=1 Tax=Dekkera bruxellensis TaxID=5007 RepID=A0A871RB02_DEKBR|nr:uncharacterized protein BRETT_004906 [Brettanomyces bruxellensis]QOU20252.1 hypothetical protein BRETT_004906 [Brettanomyces bruxellensis]